MTNRIQQRRKKRRLKRWVRLTLAAMFVAVAGALAANVLVTGFSQEKQNRAEQPPAESAAESITVSAAGDFTLGRDEAFLYEGSFPHEAEKNGLSHFTAGLDGVFQEDDLSTVNLETTLTDATEKAAKKFRFKGDPAYASILTDAGIETVNLANNHIFDYLEKGYEDTKQHLTEEGIAYVGYDDQYVTTIKGVKVGVLGYEGWRDDEATREQVSEGIKSLKEQGADIVIVHFHWGVERSYVPEDSQRSLAHFTVDEGADLIVGHHPHVVQGLEQYNGKMIVYSLGNFMFGGNRNPSDKDTFVFQQTFHIEDGKTAGTLDFKIIPFSISSRSDRNDYQPTKLEGDEKERVFEKIIDASREIEEPVWLEKAEQETE